MKNSYPIDVYGILCTSNGKWYIGSGQASKRINTHIRNLRKGCHHTLPRLQRDWDRYGECAFAFALFVNPERYSRAFEDVLIQGLNTLEHASGYNKSTLGKRGIEASIRDYENKLIRAGRFHRLPGIAANAPMSLRYIKTLIR